MFPLTNTCFFFLDHHYMNVWFMCCAQSTFTNVCVSCCWPSWVLYSREEGNWTSLCRANRVVALVRLSTAAPRTTGRRLAKSAAPSTTTHGYDVLLWVTSIRSILHSVHCLTGHVTCYCVFMPARMEHNRFYEALWAAGCCILTATSTTAALQHP